MQSDSLTNHTCPSTSLLFLNIKLTLRIHIFAIYNRSPIFYYYTYIYITFSSYLADNLLKYKYTNVNLIFLEEEKSSPVYGATRGPLLKRFNVFISPFPHVHGRGGGGAIKIGRACRTN